MTSCKCSKKSSEKNNTYTIGETFTIELERQNMGGYSWEYVKVPEVIITDSTEISEVDTKSKLVQYTKKYTLKGVESGVYELVFRKKRSFEPDSLIPEKNYKKIKVNIKKQ